MKLAWLTPLLFVFQAGRLSPHLEEGVAQLQRGQLAEAVETLEGIVRDDVEDGEAWYFLGLAHHNAGDLQQASRAHLLASRLIPSGHPLRAGAHYNMACALALEGRGERALQWLQRARNEGFTGFGQVAADADLRSLREDPRLALFVERGALVDPPPESAVVETVSGPLPGGTGGIAVAADGTVYSADFGGRVYRGVAGGDWEVFADGFTKAADCALDERGRLLQVDHGAAQVWRVEADGTKHDLGVRGLLAPVGIDTDGGGRVFVTDYRLDAVFEVLPDGATRRIAARGLLRGPNGIAWAEELGLFVVNFDDGALLRVDPESGVVRFVAELPGGGNGHVVWTGAELYVTARRDHRVYRVTPEGAVRRVAGAGRRGSRDGTAVDGLLSLPNGIALSADGGALFVNDNSGDGHGVVRRVRLREAR